MQVVGPDPQNDPQNDPQRKSARSALKLAPNARARLCIIERVREYPIGPNRNYVEGNLVYTVLGGFTTKQTAMAYLALVTEVHAEHGQVFILINNQDNHSMDPGARRKFYEFAHMYKITASATIGGGPVYRTMLTLIMRALSLVNTKVPPNGFFSTEPEARAWIKEQQRLHPPRRAPPPCAAV